MAFNWQTFKTRTITSIVFAAVMLTGLLWNQWSFFILFSIIHFGCWWEYLKLIEKIYQKTFHRYFKLGLMMVGFFALIWFRWLWYNLPLGYLTWTDTVLLVIPILGSIFLIIGYSQTQNLSKSSWPTILGFLYISLSLGLLMLLYLYGVSKFENHPPARCDFCPRPSFFQFHWSIPVIVIFSIWANDTMAYIIGSLIGKTSLSKISPKKTWEGTVGGILFTIGIALLVAWLNDLKMIHLAITAAIAAIAGTFGDLLESKLKRMAGVKDSGSFMPGFGGFLDRFDSMLLAVPAVWLYVYFFMS